MKHALLIIWIATLTTITVTAAADETTALVTQLESPDPKLRRHAAEALATLGPPIVAVRPLLRAASREPNTATLGAMLAALGHSGMLEALGLIQTHAVSPNEDVQELGRDALTVWLRRNAQLGPDESLPEPPHAFFTSAPTSFTADAPAAHPLALWEGTADAGGAGETVESSYLPPVPGGVPAGYDLAGEPSWPLLGLGIGMFGTSYALGALGGRSFDGDYDPLALIPVAGPIIAAKTFLDSEGGDFPEANRFMGAMLIINTAGQVAGIGLIIAGLVVQEPRLQLSDAVAVGWTGTGLSFHAAF